MIVRLIVHQRKQQELKKRYFIQSLMEKMIIIKRENLNNKIIKGIEKIIVIDIKKIVIVTKKMEVINL